jgi:hypothetical protein
MPITPGLLPMLMIFILPVRADPVFLHDMRSAAGMAGGGSDGKGTPGGVGASTPWAVLVGS